MYKKAPYEKPNKAAFSAAKGKKIAVSHDSGRCFKCSYGIPTGILLQGQRFKATNLKFSDLGYELDEIYVTTF